MKFIELAEQRRSIRGYKPDPVPEELLNEILLAGNLAPTAKNLQPFHFIVVRESDVLAELGPAYPRPFFRKAPVIIVIGELRGQFTKLLPIIFCLRCEPSPQNKKPLPSIVPETAINGQTGNSGDSILNYIFHLSLKSQTQKAKIRIRIPTLMPPWPDS